ncbi:MAG: hypothetical protein ACXW5U_25805 [Thermoanaerobaculia bacterium]
MWNDETRDRVLDALAYKMSDSSSPSVIEHDGARSVAADYLRSALARSEADSIEHARLLIQDLRDTRGVLIEHSAVELGFIHKSFQDFHAARFLSRRTLDEQQAFIRKWAAVPHAADVILSLCFLTNRTADVDILLDTLHATRDETASPTIDTVLAQVAFSGLNCSPARAKGIATAAIAAVEADEWNPIRVRLLHSIIDGLDSDLLRPYVVEAVSRWFPARSWRLPYVYAAMGGWDTTPELTDALVLGIRRAEIGARHAAARALAKTAARDAAVERQLHTEIRTGSGGTVAAALNALGLGWNDSSAMLALLDASRTCRDDEVSLVSALRRVTCGKQSEEDLEFLLQFAGERYGFQPKYEFRREIAEAVMSGWPGNDLVRKVCLQSIGARWREDRAIDAEIAARVLIAGYPVGDEIAEAVANVFRTSEFIDHHLGDDWPALLVRYRGHQKLSPAVDFWLKTWKHDAHLWKAFDGAVISGSPAAKRYVLDHRDHQWGYPFITANTLLRGWARDAETDAVLIEMVATVDRAQHVASLIPEILNDREKSEALLFEILEQERPNQIDGAVEALHNQGHDERSIRFADAVFRHDLGRDTLAYGSTFSDILKALRRDPRARELARRELSSRDPHADVIAAHFGDDAELRQVLLRLTSSAPDALREVIAARLSAIAGDDWDAEALLAEYDSDIDTRVKTTAAIGYWTARRRHGGIDDAAIARLNADLRATGFDTNERGHAAFAALIAIDRADIPATAKWEIGGRTSSVRSMRMHRAPLPLLRLIASRWPEIAATFGDSLWNDLTGDHAAAIEALAPFADENDELRQELVRRIETATSDELGPSSIALLAKEHRGSVSLLDALLRELKSDEGHWNGMENKLAVVDIIGRDFHNDETAGRLSLLAEQGHAQALIGLCDWWPDHRFVRGLNRATFRMDHPLGQRIRVSIDIATLESAELPAALAQTFRGMRGDIWEFHPQTTESLVRRLVRDEPLCLAAAERLINGKPTDDEFASWPGLLHRAGALSQEIVGRCAAEVKRQRRLELPGFGMDVNAGRIRAVRRALLDVIAPLN